MLWSRVTLALVSTSTEMVDSHGCPHEYVSNMIELPMDEFRKIRDGRSTEIPAIVEIT